MLITAAPLRIAARTARAEAEQVRASAPTGTLRARAPGQTPRIPTSFLGAAATAAVAVPCRLSSGRPPSVETLPPTNSGCVSSRRVSISAISGLAGVTIGGARLGPAIAARQASGEPDLGSSGTACFVGRSASGCA
jgi:hypothetical protein